MDIAEPLILVMAVLIGYLMTSKDIKSVTAYLMAFIGVVLTGIVLTWLASIFITVTVISTTEQLINASAVAIIGMIGGAAVSYMHTKISAM